jgi:hypothetical protein
VQLLLPKGAYRRANGNFPPFELVNMLAEETPSAQGGVSLLSLPGLTSSAIRGSGPIHGAYRREDLFGGAVFSVSGNTLYRDGAALGIIDGSGPVWWASSDIELCVGRGQSAWSYNGTDLQAIAFPDGANVTSGTFLSGLFVFARAQSQKYYWSAVLNARTVNALSFASAESAPDHLRDVLAIGERLALAGGDGIEFHFPTGDANLPFQRINQATTAMGVAGTGTLVELDNTFHFVGSDRVVYRMGDIPQPISHHGIDEQLSLSSTFQCFTFLWQGHKILCIRLDTSTWCFDSKTGEWHERRSWGEDNWIASCACQQADGTPLFGSAVGPYLLIHDGWQDQDNPFSREFTAALPLQFSSPVDELELEANTGSADLIVPNPEIEMRFSRDGGDTWGGWRAKSLGATGKYRKRPKWNRLGNFDAPGALFHFRVTGAIPLRVSGAINEESAAGRAR